MTTKLRRGLIALSLFLMLMPLVPLGFMVVIGRVRTPPNTGLHLTPLRCASRRR